MNQDEQDNGVYRKPADSHGSPNSGVSLVDEEHDKILKSIEPWIGELDSTCQRVREWIKSDEFRTRYYEKVHLSESTRWLLRVLRPFSAGAAWRRISVTMGVQSPELWQKYEDLAERGEIRLAQVVIVNSAIHKIPSQFVPALLVAPEVNTTGEIMLAGMISIAMAGLYSSGIGADKRPKLAALVADDDFKYFRQRALPIEEVNGFKAVALDLKICGAWTPPPDIPFLPILMISGNGNAMIQIPWHVMLGLPMPPPPLPNSPSTTQGVQPASFPILREPINAESGMLGLVSRLVRAFLYLVLAVLGLGFIMSQLPETCREKIRGTLGLRRSPSEQNSAPPPLSFTQDSKVVEQFKIVDLGEYAPLHNGILGQSAFAFASGPNLRLVACLKTPGLVDLTGPEGLKISLAKDQIAMQPNSQIQMVEAVSQTASCLKFDSTDDLQKGDKLAIILERGVIIEGELSMALNKTTRRLAEESSTLRLKIGASQSVKGKYGSPVVNLKNGHVVGILISADKPENPTIVEFDTISATPKVP